MKIWQIIAVSAAAAVTLPALAQMAPPAAPALQTRADVEARVRDRLGRFDTDKNGTVTPEEMKAVADARMKARNDERFASMDTDKNGSISRTEFDAHHKSGMMAMGRGGMGKGGDHVVRMERRRMASPEGLGQPQPATGPDGKPMMRERVRVKMMSRDGAVMADGDGKGIVIADAVKKALERFDAADTDKDGKISAEERKAQRGTWRMKVS